MEEREGRLWGYEFKWGKKRPKIPKAWLETYENAQFECINKENVLNKERIFSPKKVARQRNSHSMGLDDMVLNIRKLFEP